jgi:hypothetical protein
MLLRCTSAMSGAIDVLVGQSSILKMLCTQMGTEGREVQQVRAATAPSRS